MADTASLAGANELQLRRLLVEAGQRLYARGLIQADEGNLSARLLDGRILITPAGRCKGRLALEDLVLLSPDGRSTGDALQASSELPMHLEAYRRRQDIAAIVHAHPVCATALTVAKMPFPSDVLPEGLLTVGEVPTAAYAMPGTEEDAEAIHELILDHDAILLPHHGCLVVAVGVHQAVDLAERLEHIAQVFLWAELLGGANRLPAAAQAALRSLRLGRSS
jgi:L-fuculose-phosphate aldolase